MARLSEIIARTGGHVIIASSWRETHSPDEMQEVLSSFGFIGEVLDETPIPLGQARGEELRAYVKSAGEVDAFVILDDNADLHPVSEYAVMVDDFVGLSDADVVAAVNILGPT